MFQPSALSNPAVSTGIVVQRTQDLTVDATNQKWQDLQKKINEKEESEGLPMPVKVAIGVGVAGALGFLVYSLIK
jgi:hypothetical protein